MDGEMPKHRATEENFGKTLKIINVTLLDDGRYQCKAENAFGAVKHSFSVTVEGNHRGILFLTSVITPSSNQLLL